VRRKNDHEIELVDTTQAKNDNDQVPDEIAGLCIALSDELDSYIKKSEEKLIKLKEQTSKNNKASKYLAVDAICLLASSLNQAFFSTGIPINKMLTEQKIKIAGLLKNNILEVKSDFETRVKQGNNKPADLIVAIGFLLLISSIENEQASQSTIGTGELGDIFEKYLKYLSKHYPESIEKSKSLLAKHMAEHSQDENDSEDSGYSQDDEYSEYFENSEDSKAAKTFKNT
jgi:hypothetical protein